MDENQLSWTPVIRKGDGPVYLAIADALSVDIVSAGSAGGFRLPPQRTLADALGIDFTTVSRAYAEARKRGLIDGRIGQGTYVRARRPAEGRSVLGGLVDMSMNLPPRSRMPDWSRGCGMELPTCGRDDGLGVLLRYQEAGGTVRDRAAGVRWLSPRLGAIPAERLLVCPGAQGALLALAGVLAAPGETICTEALTYPGFRSLAAHLRINLVAVAIDEHGLVPEAFEAACSEHRPKALYCTPTLHNPTTATQPLHRREALIEIARRHQVPVIEDDAYGALPVDPVPPLAALAPDLVYYIAGLAKCLSPALRIAYLVLPDGRSAARVAGAIRATASMASPLMAAIATRWIEDGTADAVLAAIREESRHRQVIASAILPPGFGQADPQGFHAWLRLTGAWTRGEFTARLRSAGIGAVASDAFAIGSPPEAVRLGLGAAANHEDLRDSLRIVADLLAQSPAILSMVV